MAGPDSARPAAERRYLALVGALLLTLGLLGAGQLRTEWRFFGAGTLVGADGYAPVPQDDQRTPALDAALQRADALLPRQAVVVVAYDSWRREYFRASYLLMPRRVWPAVALPDQQPITAPILAAAMAHYSARYLLAPPGAAIPSGLRQVMRGSMALFVRDGAAP